MMATMLTACSDDDSDNQTNDPVISPTTEIKGLYIMCEGNWGSNNAAVDFIDFRLINFAVFNGADSIVCVGAGILMTWCVISIIKEAKLEKQKKLADGAAEQTDGEENE